VDVEVDVEVLVEQIGNTFDWHVIVNILPLYILFFFFVFIQFATFECSNCKARHSLGRCSGRCIRYKLFVEKWEELKAENGDESAKIELLKVG